MNARRVVLPVLNEGASPLTIRIEPIGLERILLPAHVAFVVAKGPADGSLEIERTDDTVSVYGWGGSQVGIEDARLAPISEDVDPCLRRVADAFHPPGEVSHHALFAALVAARYQRVIVDDGDARATRAIERLWGAANGDTLTAAETETLVASVRQVADVVDTDRTNAFDLLRALGVLERALRCSAGATGCGPDVLAFAAIAASAGVSPLDAAAHATVRARWTWPHVDRDVRWLGVVIDVLSLSAVFDEAAIEALRLAFPRTVPAKPVALPMPKPPPSQATPKPAPSPVLPDPKVVTVAIAGRSIAFIQVEGDRFRVEVDGMPRPIRMRIEHESVRAVPMNLLRKSPPWITNSVADIEPLLECLAHDATRTDAPTSVTFKAEFQWGHFRQNRWIRLSISIANDATVEIDAEVATQDESYY